LHFQAIKKFNGHMFGKRPIAVDWAVPKNIYNGAADATTASADGDKEGSDGDSENSSVDLEEVDEAVESHPPPGDDTDDDEDGSNKLTESDALDKDVGTDMNFEDEADVARKVLKNLLASSKGSTATPEGETEESDKSKLKSSSTKPVADSSGVSEPLKSGKTKVVAPKETQDNDDFERTLFIRNLPFDVTKEEVKQRFTVFGEVESLSLVLHKVTKYVSLYTLKFIQSSKNFQAPKALHFFSLCFLSQTARRDCFCQVQNSRCISCSHFSCRYCLRCRCPS
jgi:nucleolar protein 4